MKKLFANPGTLATAWFLAAALVLGAALLGFLQQLPPASGEGVTVPVALPDAPPGEPADGAAGAGESAAAPSSSEPEAETPTPPQTEPASEPATVALPPAALGEGHTPPEETHAKEAPTEAPAAHEPAPAAEAAQVPLPPAPPAEAKAEPAAPEGATAGQDSAGSAQETPAEAAPQHEATAEPPAAKVEMALPATPEPKPEAPAAAAGHASTSDHAAAETHPAAEHGTAPEAPATHGDAAAGAADHASQEAMLSIPAVPPSPEQLPQWQRFRQPFDLDDKRPRIAVVLTGLGLSESATEAAIDQLPPAITLSFSPYARGIERWIALARARGHEVMLDLPMEPSSFPNEDPGPQALLTSLSPEENVNRLDWVLSRGSAYVGLAGAMGSRFTATRGSIEPVLREMKERGLMFLDRRTTEGSLVPAIATDIGLPFAINNRSIDERQASRVAIDARLAQIERIALTEGFAVAMAQPYPVSLDRLAEWTTEVSSRGFAIAPISALADRQKIP